MFGLVLATTILFSATSLAASSLSSLPHNSTYHNPIIPGFHPDPSCILVKEWDNTFFCATSSFNAFPGVPVFASKDLRNFKQIGNVINRSSQLPLLANTNGSTSGIWAPSIRYHEGTFYVVTTLVFDHLAQNDSSRWDNIIFKTNNPFLDHWSDPVHFTFEGYDTSPYWDSSGKSYIQGSHAWRVRPVIQGFEIDLNSGNMGPIMDLWVGTGGIAPEAPHLFLKDGFYYLMIAEGGTGLGHMVTMARSKSIWGPFEPDPANPVLTNANTTEYFQTVGHADLFSDTQGNWWSVALSTRSGPDFIYFPMGRETVLTPVEWKRGEFPTFAPVRGQESGPLPSENKVGLSSVPGTWIGSAKESLTFAPGTTLPKHFVYNRFPDPAAYTISPEGHANSFRLVPSLLNLTALEGRLAATPQTFVGRRQEHVEFTLEATLDFNPTQDQTEAGLTVFLNQAQHFDLGIVALTGASAVQAGFTGATGGNANATGLQRYVRLRTITSSSKNMGSQDSVSLPGILLLEEGENKSIKLQIQAVNSTWYAFRYKAAAGPVGSEWTTVGWGTSSEVSGGFTGTILGMFATANGGAGRDPAYFSEFSYNGNPDVF